MKSGTLARKSSVVIGQTSPVLVSKTLTANGCTSKGTNSPFDGAVDVAFSMGASDELRLGQAVVQALVHEACGTNKGVIKRPDGDIVLDAAGEIKELEFGAVVKSLHFSFGELPDGDAVAAIAEMSFTRCLKKVRDPSFCFVTGFPGCLTAAGGSRVDFAVGGMSIFSMRLNGSDSYIRINTSHLDTTMGRMCSTNFVESVLPAKWQQLASASMQTVTDMLEDVQNAINDYWQGSPQNERAKAYAAFLLNAVGTDLRAYFDTQTKPAGVFRGSKKVVEYCLAITEDWIGICDRLTTIDWGADWGTARFSDLTMQKLRVRLNSVVGMRTLHEEIFELLDSFDMRTLRGENLWDVFDAVDVFDAAASADVKWDTAMSAFNRRMEPIEHRCASSLRDFFAARASLSPQAILGEFAQFKQLVKRPVVGKELSAERDSLLAKLSERLTTIRLEFEHRAHALESEAQVEEDRRCQTGKHMPGNANKIIWLQQLRGKSEQMLSMTKSMLADLSRTSEFEENATSLLREIEEYEMESFKNWTFDVHDRARQLTLDANAPLMEIDNSGKVEVNYSERLVELLREVRIFGALGFTVPTDIQQMATQGLKFYQNGVALKQVANMYNTMDEDIIPSTRAMLLDSALVFEKVIGSGSSKLTWRNTQDAEHFIEKLRNAAAVLSGDNRRLHRLHAEIAAVVLELFKIDLLRSKDRWMGRVRLIREKMVTSGFTNMDAWSRHWDAQIYKALEHQYQIGLESLHEVIPEIRADVVMDSHTGQAALRPPLPNLRETFMTKIKDFVTFPNRFTGVGNSEFFKKMPSFNERGINAVMQHAASMFKKIEKELKRFTPLLIIGRCGLNGSPTLEQVVEACLSEVQHWEANIRLLKQKGKEVSAIDTFMKIDCITLSTAGLKGTIEEHLSRLAQCLNTTLRRSAEAHLNKISTFLEESAAVLDSKLLKLEEIGKANIAHSQLMEKRPAIEVEFHHFFNKNRLVQSMSGTAGIEFAEVKTKWDAFCDRLDSHEQEVEAQLEEMKGAVDSAVREWVRDVEKFTAQWHELKPKDTKTPNAAQIVTEKAEAFEKLKSRGAELISQCKFFSMDEPEMTAVEELGEDIESFVHMWGLMGTFNDELKQLRDEPWISFRSKLYKFEDFIKAWQDKLRELASNTVVLHLRTTMDEWMRLVPLLKFARGDGMTPTHWKELFNLLGVDRSLTQDTIQFGHLLDRHEVILRKEKELKQLHARALGEAQIREALDDVRSWGQEAKFSLVPHPDRKGVVLITDWKDILSAVNDNQALLFSIKDSPFFGPFADDAAKWETRLATLDQYLHYMVSIQRKWVYLEPIFARGALPHEQERFQRTDKQYLAVMKDVERDPKVVSLAAHTEYKETLKLVQEQLERCQKSLNEFLEKKRDIFPRFYFISDDDLLEILGQSKNVQVIQNHLKKLFMGIHSVRFDNNKKHIVEINSIDGETVPLLKPVQIVDEVEDWLNALDKEMKQTLQTHLVQCVDNLDVSKFASQILCTCEQIHFTRKTEDAIRNSSTGGLPKHKANLQAQLRELTRFAASNTDVVIDLKLKALVMDLIHNIEVVDLLMDKKVVSESHWLWRKQLRYYLGKDNLCVLKMVDASFKYSYEYQGNAPKLVHTPLTDKCYLTLTQGMHLGYGGNPYGPAGTGKTESVKALGNAMGRQVLVFNCDEGIDFKSMGRIFTGLVKCGAWGCFDEFNRLKVDQLSAVSQMIQVIQEALKQGESSCHLLGRVINVNSNAGIFVTLNPAGKGYGGRSNLPDNLKQLFRAVAMSIPDIELISATILYSEGFEHAQVLSKKMVEIFRLSKQLLSHQQHYDWGLRALKAVLRLGGKLIHQFLKNRVETGENPPAEEVLRVESEIIIKSLRVNTLSKLTFDDVFLFNGLITDVFPGVDVREIQYDELRPAIVEAVKDLKLQLVEGQVQKILQLYEALNQRMGVVLVGPSGSGKSTLLKILRKAMQILGTKVPQYVMNPKAMPRDQLLGHMDMDTREWFDGVLTEAAKRVVREENVVRSWVLCDGDIDPEWVESLNSVLDDNKLLTMPNGVRVQFGNNVNFIFETHSLQFASPATVSRMGMIFLSEHDVEPATAIKSWLAEQPAEVSGKLGKWIDEYFYKAIETLNMTKALIVETTSMGLVTSALSQLHNCNSKSQFASALVLGLGGYLPEVARVDFAKDIYYLVGERVPDPKNPVDCYFDTNSGSLQKFQHESTLDMSVDDLKNNPMINTVDCQRNMHVMEAWTRHDPKVPPRPFIVVGPEGCGKTMLLTNIFANLSNVKVAVVNCSARTVAAHVIQKLKQTCQQFNTNQGRVLRPKDAERLVLLMKDLNLPKPDKYGTVQLHSFLQQLILYQGFYDGDLEWVTVERVQIVGSMNPPGTMGRFPVSPRFIAIVSVLTVSYPSTESLTNVYTEFFNILLQSPQLQNISIQGKGAADIARAVISVYENVVRRYTVDDASHYVFNPRDVTNWVLSLLSYNTQTCGVVEILVYEGRRIFADRLVSKEERTKFDKTVRDAFTHLGYHGDEKDDRVYVSWLEAAPTSASEGKKLSVAKPDDIKKSAEENILLYTRENTDINIQLIPEVVQWMARVDRVFSRERGHVFMVGRTGVLSREIVQLVAFIHRMDLFSLSMSREYSIKTFQLELKIVLAKAGIEGQHCVLLLEDHNFGNPSVLEMINSLLASGEVPGLYTQEELDAQLGPLKEEAMQEGFTEGVYYYFVDRICRFLHIVVVSDYTNDEYELRCRSNPSLFTKSNVCWVGTWGGDSMKLLPRLMLKDVFRALDQRSDKKDFSLTNELVHTHRSAGDKFSPQHFRTLIETYGEIFREKNSSSGDSLQRLQRGLEKLAEAEENVDTIKKEVSLQKVEMETKQKEADEALVEIQAKMEEAGTQKKQIQKIQKEIDAEQKVVVEKKSGIEGQLAGVQPILDAAKEAVGQIRNEHLSELKSMKTPPAAVQDVLEAVLVLLGKTETSWAAIRKFLAGGNITSMILNFDAHNMDEKLRDSVQRMIDQKSNSFKPEVIARASRAAAPMAEWLKANVEYSKVLESVQPMNDELAKYENNLKKGQERMQRYTDKLSKVEKKVDELKKNFGQKTKEAERLKDKLEQAEQMLGNAEQLLQKLAGEKSRWSDQVAAIKRDMHQVPRRAMLAAAYITYLGQEPEDARRRIVHEWKERQKAQDFGFFTFLRSESKMLQYKSEKLPGDELSLDNAVIIMEQVRTAMIIDPASQALEWLTNHLKGSSTIEVCSISDERLINTLELAIRFGKTLILTDVDRIDPFLYPLIRKELKSEGTKKVVQLGDRKSIDYAEGFQLFLITRSTDLKLPPDAASFVTEISFTITQGGLEGQLLGVTIQHEQPELEHQKLEMLQNEESLKMQLAALEEALLTDLAQSQGSLLENTTLIETLNKVKTQANEIGESLTQSRAVQEQLDEKRNVYRPFAATGSKIFFLVKNLRALSHMYQFSLGMFLHIFTQTLDSLTGAQLNTEDKIVELSKVLGQRVVKTVSRALFKEHRVTFGIHLARALNADTYSETEWNFFIEKAVASDQKRAEVSIPSWVFPDTRSSFQLFGALFSDLLPKMNVHETDVWYQWMRVSAPEESYPSFLDRMSDFQRLLVVKTLRPDRLMAATTKWACELLNVLSLSDNSTIEDLLPTTTFDEPILMITTPGADPSQELQALAYKNVGRDKFFQIAMGGGQTEEGMRLVKQCAADGSWLFLKNLHLVIPWVSQLQKELNMLEPHKEFRLWLTSETHDEFPSILLAHSVKVTFEAPPGIKQNLIRTYNQWPADFIGKNTNIQAQLLLCVAWLHAIVQERRSYIPQGWAKFYEFSQADLKSAADVVLQQSGGGAVDWESIHGIFENAVYGGRMETEFDVRILRTYLKQFFSEDVLAGARKPFTLFKGWQMPSSGRRDDFLKLVDALPESDVPGVFSLPPNADRAVQRSRVAQVVTDLQRLQETKEASKMSREEWAAKLTPLLQTWMELCQPHADLLTHSPDKTRHTKPIAGFIAAEVAASLSLLSRVEQTMADLRKVIDGTLLLSEERREEAAAMITNEVPLAWDNAFVGPARIIPWMTALVGKAVAIRQWQQASDDGSLLKQPLNLADLFRPQTFLNALRQETAHMTREPLVSLSLISKIGAPPPGAALAVNISGLLLQGAAVDESKVLTDIATADAAAFVEMPDVFLAFSASKDESADQAALNVPVYANATKENIVMELMLPCASSNEGDRFVLSGAAVLLED